MTVAALLLLADGRFPDGSHAHSHGLEAAVDVGRVHDPGSLEQYVTARLWTVGRTDSATARLAAAHVDSDELDHTWCVRTPSAAARSTSRALGRSLARTAAKLAPDTPVVLSDGRPPVQPVAFGLLASALGCSADEASLASAHGTAATLAAAGLRLLSLDPFDVAAVLAGLRAHVEQVAASTAVVTGPGDVPHVSTPFAEIDVEHQRALATRLFRS